MPTTTTTTTLNSGFLIGRIPENQLSPGEQVTFYIKNGQYDCKNSSFVWRLDDNIVSTEDTFTTIFEYKSNHLISVEVTEYIDNSWMGGRFYGGTFRGKFSGGTFNYGNLNDCCIISQVHNNKIFTSKI